MAWSGGSSCRPTTPVSSSSKPVSVESLNVLFPVRLQTVRLPDACHCGAADAMRPGHGSGAPTRCVRRPGMKRRFHDRGHLRSVQPFRGGAARRILRQADRSVSAEAVAPQDHGRPGYTQPLRDPVVRDPVGGQQAYPCPLCKSLRGRPGADPGFERVSIGQGHGQSGFWFPHEPRVPDVCTYCQSYNWGAAPAGSEWMQEPAQAPAIARHRRAPTG